MLRYVEYILAFWLLGKQVKSQFAIFFCPIFFVVSCNYPMSNEFFLFCRTRPVAILSVRLTPDPVLDDNALSCFISATERRPW